MAGLAVLGQRAPIPSVAIAFGTGNPALRELASRNLAAVLHAWGAFAANTGWHQGFGKRFLGLSLLTAGRDSVTRRPQPSAPGAEGLRAAVAAVGVCLVSPRPRPPSSRSSG